MADKRIAVVGASGTVALHLRELLESRPEWAVSRIHRDTPEKDRQRILNTTDLAVLCLPDDASRDFVSKAPESLRILDTSSAFRNHPAWTYGLPELSREQPERIQLADRVSNPGCFATGAVLILNPISHLLAEYPVSVTGIGGYTSGGRRMVEAHATEPFGYRMFGLDLNHRHVREIQRHGGLARPPIFIPGIGHHARGTLVQVPLHLPSLGLCALDLTTTYVDRYEGTGVILRTTGGKGYIDGAAMEGKDGVVLHVLVDSTGESAVVVAVFDNLGKGAAGAAFHNIEEMLNA